MAEAGNANPFNAKTIIWLIVAGFLAFGAFLFLTAYAPKWDRGGDGGTNVLSRSAVGFSGLKQLAELTKRPTDLGEDKQSWWREGLVIVPVSQDVDTKLLEQLVTTRRSVANAITLFVLPKWETIPMQTKRGFVQGTGVIAPASLNPIMEKLGAARIGGGRRAKDGRVRGVEDDDMPDVDVAQPAFPRHLTGDIAPVLRDSSGKTILGRVEDENDGYTYILADPDLLSNKGLKTKEGARNALLIVDALRNGDKDSVAFDMVLAGFGDKRNLLQLMFEPPFLAFTLALIVAGILIGLHATGRFGPPAIEGRAIALGKRALADNATMLISRAGREDRLGERYVAVIRDSVGAALGAGALAPETLEKWLGSLPGGFENLAFAARTAPDAAAMRVAAADLYQWKKDVTRDHR